MNARDIDRVLRLAVDAADEMFPLQRQADVPDLEPGEAWSLLNDQYPENAVATEAGPTPMDRLFASAYRRRVAWLWMQAANEDIDRAVTDATPDSKERGDG